MALGMLFDSQIDYQIMVGLYRIPLNTVGRSKLTTPMLAGTFRISSDFFGF